MEISPLRDFVFLEEILPPKESGSGLIIEHVDLEPTKKAIVVKLGIDIRDKTFIQEGDKVVYRPHLFEDVVLNERKLLVGRLENIFAVLHD